jgi:hypothetical protein
MVTRACSHGEPAGVGAGQNGQIQDKAMSVPPAGPLLQGCVCARARCTCAGMRARAHASKQRDRCAHARDVYHVAWRCARALCCVSCPGASPGARHGAMMLHCAVMMLHWAVMMLQRAALGCCDAAMRCHNAALCCHNAALCCYDAAMRWYALLRPVRTRRHVATSGVFLERRLALHLGACLTRRLRGQARTARTRTAWMSCALPCPPRCSALSTSASAQEG